MLQTVLHRLQIVEFFLSQKRVLQGMEMSDIQGQQCQENGVDARSSAVACVGSRYERIIKF